VSFVRGLPVGPPVAETIQKQRERDQPFLRPERPRGRRGARSVPRFIAWSLPSVALVLATAVVTAAVVEHFGVRERLRVRDVAVRGNRFLSEGEVRELIGPAIGESLLTVDLDQIRRNLAASPWVGVATVRREMPSTLRVDIIERVPLAFAESDQLYVMDRGGDLIDLLGPRTSGFDLPIVRGLQSASASEREARARRAAALIEDLDDLAAEVSEISVDRSNDLVLVLRGDSSIVKLAEPPYRERLVSFLQLRHKLRERCPDAEYFDLRFKNRIYVKPASGDVAADVTGEN
jgi:cell division septal protein FtsQ